MPETSATRASVRSRRGGEGIRASKDWHVPDGAPRQLPTRFDRHAHVCPLLPHDRRALPACFGGFDRHGHVLPAVALNATAEMLPLTCLDRHAHVRPRLPLPRQQVVDIFTSEPGRGIAWRTPRPSSPFGKVAPVAVRSEGRRERLAMACRRVRPSLRTPGRGSCTGLVALRERSNERGRAATRFGGAGADSVPSLVQTTGSRPRVPPVAVGPAPSSPCVERGPFHVKPGPRWTKTGGCTRARGSSTASER